MGSLRGPRSTDLDRYIGAKVREYRLFLGLGQEKLGQKVGVTFQQIQKYELGHNRLAASRLATIAKALGRSIYDFIPDNVFAPPVMTVLETDRTLLSLFQLVRGLTDAEREKALQLLRVSFDGVQNKL